jgi:transketolase
MTSPSSRVLESGLTTLFWSYADIVARWKETRSLKVVADCARLNALTAIQCAGSGHIGTSLSSVDLMVAIRRFLGGEDFLHGEWNSNVFFSSKGHDAPAYYATMHACGVLDDDALFTLRRLGGLPGHPETVTPGVPTNTGSLGMGISKAKGFVKSQRLRDPQSRQPVVVMLGDGELNEGQIWESMPGAVRDGFSELTAIVDANRIQSDTWTEATLPMGDLRQRVEGVGWIYRECDGNSPDEVLEALVECATDSRPSFIVGNTVKGSGVPWMEQFPDDGEYYKFHSGALDPELYSQAAQLLAGKGAGTVIVDSALTTLDRGRPEADAVNPRIRPESLLTIWETMLCGVMKSNPQVVALDGDLSFDTGTHLARKDFPDRYVQAGIAEQDMVSMAGTLALSGQTPIVHSFATFLTMRATEQIFNNATEYSRIIYMGFLAGLVPSAPGFSHQAVTDVPIMSSIPGMRVFEPSCGEELRWSIEQALGSDGPSYIRVGGLEPAASVLAISPYANARRLGSDGVIVSSGPLMTNLALAAAETLYSSHGLDIAVYTVTEICAEPDESSLEELSKAKCVFVLENHNPAFAKYEILRARLSQWGCEVFRLGLAGVPANGGAGEVLEFHELSAKQLVSRLLNHCQ